MLTGAAQVCGRFYAPSDSRQPTILVNHACAERATLEYACTLMMRRSASRSQPQNTRRYFVFDSDESWAIERIKALQRDHHRLGLRIPHGVRKDAQAPLAVSY